MGFPRGQTRTATGGAVGGGGANRMGGGRGARDFTPVPKERRARTLRRILVFFEPYRLQVLIVLAVILSLVYRFTRNGHLRLSALEYLVTRAAWRAHHPKGRPELFGHRFNFTPAGNRFGLPAYFSLHAWLWYANPAGTYQMFNPRVHCPAGI